LAAPLMKRAVKRTALDPPDEGQEPVPFLSEPATASVIEEPAAQRQSAPQARLAIFYDEDSRFVPPCACGAYGSFGVGVSLRHGREGRGGVGLTTRSVRNHPL